MSHICDGRDLTCASCLTLARRLETVRAAMTVDDELDDVKRARIWMQLEDRLADAGPPRRSRAAIATGVAAATAVAAAGLFLALAPRDDDRHTLAVPVDTVVTSRLGPHTRASIVGPAQLDILGTSGGATAIRLRSGTLLVEFDGGSGRSLRVDAPGAAVEVVGTLFAVAVRDGATCTSVAHGEVRITTRNAVVHVTEGQRYCNSGAIRPISDDMRDALTQHGSRVARSPASTVSTDSNASPPIASAAAVAAGSSPVPAPSLAPGSAPEPGSAAAELRPPEPGSAAAELRPPEPASAAAEVRRHEPAVAGAEVRRNEPAPTAAEVRRHELASAGEPRRHDPAPAISEVHRHEPASTGEPRRHDPAPVATVRSREPTPAVDVGARARDPAPAAAEAKPIASPDELYQEAEAALAARDAAAADRALARLVDEHPISLLVDQALYERARIAYQRRAWDAARSHLARLAAIVGTRLAEPGKYLRCRIAVESRESSAAACLIEYRAAFPSSPHDLDALALLAQLAHASSGCAGAEKLVAELAERYPRASLTTAWRARCPEPR
jgi:hypothetical protein